MIILRTKHFGVGSLSQTEEEAARMRMRMWPKTIFEKPVWHGESFDKVRKEASKDIKKLREDLTEALNNNNR